MSKKYWIGTTEEYEYQLTQHNDDGRVKRHAPIYNQDNTMVLVAGYGDMTLDEVKQYQIDSNWYPEEAI